MSTPTPAASPAMHPGAPVMPANGAPVMPAPAQRVRAVGTSNVSLFSVLRSERIKLWSLRSTYWVAAICIVLTIGLGSLMGFGITQLDADMSASPAMLSAVFSLPAYFVAMITAALGVLAVTTEYSTGQIRSTLAAVPSRWPVSTAKVLVVSVSATLISLVGNLLTLPFLHLFLSSRDIEVFTTGTLKTVLLTALFHLLMAMMGAGLGFLLRHTAGAITVVAVELFVLIIALQIAGIFLARIWEPLGKLDKYLPANAGMSMIAGESVGKNLLILLVWVLVPLITGAILFKRRDA
ncbi:ABC transporter permease subunit [Buchananella felis]|uniref:ABC transporter permease subunit n=1 Tax=Buchananella felis TaxID=3231492 RepID=UPI0035286404